jgi:hypothetical protein
VIHDVTRPLVVIFLIRDQRVAQLGQHTKIAREWSVRA